MGIYKLISLCYYGPFYSRPIGVNGEGGALKWYSHISMDNKGIKQLTKILYDNDTILSMIIEWGYIKWSHYAIMVLSIGDQ